jgi:L-malate glycosyltransferase
VIRRVLALAKAVITQNRLTFGDLPRQIPQLGDKIRYLPPAADPGRVSFALREKLHPSEGPVFLHPAGIRPVKMNLELLHLFDRLPRQRDWQVAFCGPILDENYGRSFLMAVAERSWSHYLGVVEPAAMGAALRQADVILNHSSCEGLPNVLLEAAVLGRPMLVRNIEGNAAVVENGINGLLYDDEPAFLQQALRLISDAGLRQQLSQPSPERYDPRQEALTLENIYRETLVR